MLKVGEMAPSFVHQIKMMLEICSRDLAGSKR